MAPITRYNTFINFYAGDYDNNETHPTSTSGEDFAHISGRGHHHQDNTGNGAAQQNVDVHLTDNVQNAPTAPDSHTVEGTQVNMTDNVQNLSTGPEHNLFSDLPKLDSLSDDEIFQIFQKVHSILNGHGALQLWDRWVANREKDADPIFICLGIPFNVNEATMASTPALARFCFGFKKPHRNIYGHMTSGRRDEVVEAIVNVAGKHHNTPMDSLMKLEAGILAEIADNRGLIAEKVSTWNKSFEPVEESFLNQLPIPRLKMAIKRGMPEPMHVADGWHMWTRDNILFCHNSRLRGQVIYSIDEGRIIAHSGWRSQQVEAALLGVSDAKVHALLEDKGKYEHENATFRRSARMQKDFEKDSKASRLSVAPSAESDVALDSAPTINWANFTPDPSYDGKGLAALTETSSQNDDWDAPVTDASKTTEESKPFVPGLGVTPNWEMISSFKEKQEINKSMRYDEDGQRLAERVSYSQPTAVIISDIQNGEYKDRRWLSPYTAQYARSGGQKLQPGARTTVAFTNAEFGYGVLEFACILTTSTDKPQIDLPYAKWSISTIAASAPDMKRLSAGEYRQFCCQHGLVDSDDEQYDEVHKLAFRVKLDGTRYVERRNTTLRYDRDRLKNWNSIRQHTHDRATSATDTEILVECIFPGYNNIPQRIFKDLAQTVVIAANDPYEFFFQKVPNARVFMSASDMPSVKECRFMVPDAAVNVFNSVMEQTGRLGVALRDEHVYTESRMALAKKLPARTLALELPNHKVKGVTAGFIFIWQNPDIELVPEEGELFRVRVDNVEFDMPDLPSVTLTRDEKCKRISGRINKVCDIARDTSGGDDKRFKGYIYKALDEVVKENGKGSRENFIARHASDLLPRKRVLGKVGASDKPAEKPAEHAERVREWVDKFFSYLRLPSRTIGQCPDLMATRIQVPTWMEALGVLGAYVRTPTVPDWPKDDHPAPRIDVKVPCIPLSTNPLETIKYARSHLKDLTFTSRLVRMSHDGQLKAGLHALARAGKDTNELSTDNFDAYMRYLAKAGGEKIIYDLTQALPLLNDFLQLVDEVTSATDPFLQQALKMYQKLDNDQKNLFARVKNLPFGTAVVSGGPGSGKNHVMQLLLTIIQHSPVRRKVVNAWNDTKVADVRTELAEINEKLPAIQRTKPESYEHLLRNDAAREKYKERMQRYEAVQMGTTTAVSENDVKKQGAADNGTPVAATDQSDLWEGVAAPASQFWNTTAREQRDEAKAQDKKNEFEPLPMDIDENDSIEFDQAPQSDTNDSEDTEDTFIGQLLIVAPVNDMLDRTCENLSATHRSLGVMKRIVRVQMPQMADRDMAERLNPEFGTGNHFDEMEDDEAFETQVRLAALGRECMENYRRSPATGGEFAVSARVAKRIANATPEDKLAYQISELNLVRKKDPETFFALYHRLVKSLCKRVADEEYEAADVLVGTPEAIYRLMCRKLKLRIMAVWQDECFRMTEPETLIAITHTPQAVARFLTGDDNQCSPIVTSADAHKTDDVDKAFCSQFGYQLARSLPRRLIRGGVEAHYLNYNHRARGGVSRFASRQYYEGNMVESHDTADISPEQGRIWDWFKEMAGTDTRCGPILGINLPGEGEKQVGTSWINPDSIKVIIHLLKSIYQTNMLCSKHPTAEEDGELLDVLVVFKYKQQCLKFKAELAKIPPAFLPHDRIRGEVVQVAQGGEASLVIMDETRDNGNPGYTGQSQLSNTAITRAKFGIIAIYCDKNWKGSIKPKDPRVRNQADLDRWCASRRAVIRLPPSFFKELPKHAIRKGCLVCPPGQNRHNPEICPKAWSSVFSSSVPAGTTLPKELRGLEESLYNRIKYSTKKRKTPRELRGRKDKRWKTRT